MANEKTGATEHPKAAAVRKAAGAFADAIDAARKAGVTVAWPSGVDALRTIAISETAKAETTSDDGADTLTGTKVATEPAKTA